MSSTDALPLDAALADFLDHQRARRRSERTRELYRQTVTRFADWLTATGRPATVVVPPARM